MPIFLPAFFRAAHSLFAPGMFRIMIYSIILTILALFGFIALASGFFSWLGGHLSNPDLAQVTPWLGSISSVIIAWFLFPGIMPVIVNFFDTRIADLIESQEYATTPLAKTPFWPEFLHDARFSIMAIGLNILILPLYLLPLINVFLFYFLNGYLLGREFFVMAARRHIPTPEAEALRKQHSRLITLSGAAIAFAATIPFINLIAPFWGIALMTHLYHRLAGTKKAVLILPR